MSISTDEMNTNIIWVQATESIQQVRNKIGDDLDSYVVVSDGPKFYLFQLQHLNTAVLDAYDDVSAHLLTPLKGIPEFLEDFETKALDNSDHSVYLKKAQKTAAILKTTSFKGVVIVDGGLPIGVVMTGASGGAVRGAGSNAGGIIPVSGSAGTLGASAAASPPAAASAPVAAASVEPMASGEARPTDPRIVNVELLDDDYEKLDPKEKPLKKETTYTLSFFVDKIVSDDNITTEVVDLNSDGSLFAPDEDVALLEVQLESDDFDIDNKKQNLKVPRTGKSKKARFDMVPKEDGPATVHALFFKNGAFIQVITLQFFVGELFKSETRGRDLNQASLLTSRDLNLTILKAVDGYQMIMSGPTAAIAKIPITQVQLHTMIADFRQILLDTVKMKVSGVNIYQTRIEIPKSVDDRQLPILANAGYDFFDKLFYGPGHDMQANLMGDKFKEMAKAGKLNIQIFATEFTLPWGLLYIGDDPDEPDPEMFLGMKHVIEYVPLQPKMQVTERAIDTSNGIRVGLNVNKDIDAQMGTAIIGRQLDYWDKLSKENSAIQVDVRDQAPDVLDALNDGDAEDDILYFYCHAESYDLSEKDKGGPDSSQLIMTNHKSLVLRKLSRNKNSLPGQPLVFINACESAEMSPQFYDGFVPYFMNKGARGVIGTECETPALFAEEWANRFFRRFLKGEQNLGEIFLELRREFYFDQNNVMGLLYALYVDGNTYVSDGLVKN